MRFLTIFLSLVSCSNAIYMMYLTGQHNKIPEYDLISKVTHVALAFMRSDSFNSPHLLAEYTLFTSIDEVRSAFPEGTKVLIAIGGWGDTEGFSVAAKTGASRALFAESIRVMLKNTGADGVDIDWEYPGGNGEDYKTVPNALKEWEIEAYPLLLADIRKAIGPKKLLSAAVPGLPRDMLAFTSATVPAISSSVDFLNIMTYDLMNRRDNVTKHHTSINGTLTALDAYLDAGLPVSKANVGFAFYVKWFRVKQGQQGPELGRKTVLMEDPVTGRDLGWAGAFAWGDVVPEEFKPSFERAKQRGQYDDIAGGYYYLDEEQNLWWSWDTPEAILAKKELVQESGVGVFAWGLGEDSWEWRHLQALNELIDERPAWVRDEL